MKIPMLHLKIGLYLLEMCNSYRLWTQDFDIVMPMSNLIEYSDNYSDNLDVYGSLKEINLQ